MVFTAIFLLAMLSVAAKFAETVSTGDFHKIAHTGGVSLPPNAATRRTVRYPCVSIVAVMPVGRWAHRSMMGYYTLNRFHHANC